MAGADPARLFLEVGPRATSTTLARQILKEAGRDIRAMTVPSLEDWAEVESAAVQKALGQLWLAGVEVDWEAFQALGRRRVVSLPSYPFARERHWLDPELPSAKMNGEGRPAVRFSNTPPAPGPAPVAGIPAASDLERTILAQLAVMDGQLKLLRE